MRCRHAQKLLSAYLDGALPGQRTEAVRDHLAACERCRARHDRLATLVSSMRGEPLTPAPDLWPRIRAAASTGAAVPDRTALGWFDLAVAYGAVAAACVLLALSVAVGSHRAELPEPSHAHPTGEQILADSAWVLAGDVTLARGPALVPELEAMFEEPGGPR